MPIVNYVREHTRFIEYASDEHLTSSERLVWYALMHIMNQRAQGNIWPDEFVRINNDRLLSYCPMKFDTLATARNNLKQKRLIDYLPGKKNKESPAYRMIYFYPQYAAPETERDGACNAEKSDYMGGNMGYNTGGNMGYNTGGNTGDISINYTDNGIPIPKSEEDNPTTEEDARARGNRLYPKRTGPLSAKDERTLMRLRVWLGWNVNIRRMFGEGMAIIEAMLDSDRYPIELVGYAIEKTVERNAKYEIPLGNPVAYTQKLLEDWESRGFATIEDIQEAKDDWGHYA